MEKYTFEYIESGLISNVHYEKHKRGRNWVSKIVGKNSVQFERTNIGARGGKFCLVDAIACGDVIEMGGDYISGGGVRTPDRGYYLVLAITEKGVECGDFPTMAKALKAQKSLIEATV